RCQACKAQLASSQTNKSPLWLPHGGVFVRQNAPACERQRAGEPAKRHAVSGRDPVSAGPMSDIVVCRHSLHP
ncbi:hypothetical protein, partial [Ancylobacter tetraedralis]|uniref:hypothetical protein n=1 Tax=Ancylobacter tetraedralis TaxID=217068 RepID=UPI001AED2591